MMYPKLLISSIIIGTPVLYLLSLHRSLSRKISHTTRRGFLKPSTSQRIASIPTLALTEQCPMIHDTASKAIRKSLLPSIDNNTLLTEYLRRNMQLFSQLPQAWMLRTMATPSERKTFDRVHIETLDFEEGDTVCGSYSVVLRTPGKVEFALKPLGSVNGRLLIEVVEIGEDLVFNTETVMWKGPQDKIVMPLERNVVKWMHELASWWLLDSGTRYLTNLRKS